MHLIATQEGRTMQDNALAPRPFGAGFDAKTVAKAVKMEIHGSGVDDEGADFCLFKLFDEKGDVVAERKIPGY
jgi:hypothetical protein